MTFTPAFLFVTFVIAIVATAVITFYAQRRGGLVLAHYTNSHRADPEFMKAVATAPNLETVVRGGMAIALTKK